MGELLSSYPVSYPPDVYGAKRWNDIRDHRVLYRYGGMRVAGLRAD